MSISSYHLSNVIAANKMIASHQLFTVQPRDK